MKKPVDVASIFPILSVDETGVLFSKNGDYCVAFSIDYPEVFIQTENNYAQCFEVLVGAVKNLGEGYLIHKQDFFIGSDYQPDMSYIQNNDFVLKQNELHFKDRPFFNHRGYLYIIHPNNEPTEKDSMNSSLFKKMATVRDRAKNKTLSSFLEKVKAFAVTVNQSKIIGLQKLNREQIVGTKETTGLLDTYFTLSYSDKNLYDISNEAGIFRVGNQGMYTFVINDLDQYPADLPPVISFKDYSTDRTKMPASYGLSFGLGLRVNHVYNQILYIPSQSSTITKLVADTKRHFSFSSWSRDNTFSMEQKTHFVDSMKDGLVAVKAHFNVQTFHSDTAALEEQKDMVSSAIQSTGFISKVATTYSPQLFWSCIPGNASEIGYDNLATISLSNAVAMFNLESNYSDSAFQNAGILVTDRNGSPRNVDVFFFPLKEGLISNRNFTVIGPSGSGKSFTMNNLVYYLLASKAHVTIVDIGHSYKRLGEILGAKYITHSEEKPISLNPFYFKGEEFSLGKNKVSELKEEFIEVIVKIVFLLYKKEGDKVAKSEEVTLFNMVKSYYEYLDKNKNVKPCFNTFYEFSKNVFPAIFESMGGKKEQFDFENFYFVLTPFYRGGNYAFLLNSEEEIDYAKEPFVIYELDNIKDHPILLPVITLMITNTYMTKLFSLSGVLKVLIIEEAWRAVSSEFFATFLLWAFKTARKHFGAIGVVTQEIEDLLKSEIIKDAIVQNTDIKIIMDIRKYLQQAEEVLKLFKISSNNVPQIFSINRGTSVNRGPFKELAIILGDSCKVYGVEVSKYAAALFTTEPTQVAKIKKIADDKRISQKDAAFLFAEEEM
ncbi:TraG family conjugative transposon ATPase [Runella limosa]|uniref:TraG family conjugative transposon ATPase n=1 Tax=Runella limosa TaxID=370978 RepID=UPI0004258ADB|nr:TraG family conjugative transposon ATPase [Runella limosa]